MNRRELLKLLVLGGAGTMLGFCRREPEPTPQREIPHAFRELVGDLGAQPSLDLFIGAKEFVAGTNSRVPFVLVGSEGSPIEGEAVQMYAALAAPSRASAEFHRFGSGALHSHESESDEHASPFESEGFYDAEIALESPGFVHLMAVTEKPPMRAGFAAVEVTESSKVPSEGGMALPVDTPTTGDLRGAAYLCTNEPPCPMHASSLREVLTSGRPSVFTVATPRFCRSRLCGPVLEEVLIAREKWGNRVDFVHAEVYADEEAKTPSSSMTTWSLDSEPWVFLMDSSGTIRGRFEGPVVSGQVQEAIEGLVS